MNFPAVLLRTSTERPEVVDKGSIVIGGINVKDLLEAIFVAKELFKEHPKNIKPLDYMDTNVSIKVVKIIESYTKIIDKVTWYKY